MTFNLALRRAWLLVLSSKVMDTLLHTSLDMRLVYHIFSQLSHHCGILSFGVQFSSIDISTAPVHLYICEYEREKRR